MKCSNNIPLAFLISSPVTQLLAPPEQSLPLFINDPPDTKYCDVSSVPYQERYTGVRYNQGMESRLRISNGGAGQSGLVAALASAYIDWSRENRVAMQDYAIDWIVGDTTDSIKYISTGDADIAITYNAAAEHRALNLSIATKRVYGFRDHFYLVGPKANPAKLEGDTDSIHDMFNKIVTSGDAGNGIPPTRFLSRYDKSATNIKESLIFAQIGQVPWSYAYSKWYHQYPLFPIPALMAASLLQEYTLTDRSTFLTLTSQNKSIATKLTVYKAGDDKDPADPLLSPAAILLGGKICEKNVELAEQFLSWMVDPNGGQAVVRSFTKPETGDFLYSTAPDCTRQPEFCEGW